MTFWKISVWVFLVVSGRLSCAVEALDMSLEPPAPTTREITRVFRDMVVVQRKAKEKAHKYLFSPYASFDFSDGPTTMYGLNVNPGYAFSDYFELYLNLVPAFVVQERDVVKRVREYTLIDGNHAELNYSRPKFQYGLEMLWAPAYGKDSWGPRSIVRSDTFFKLGAGQIVFESGSGLRAALSLGKTFFLSRIFNLRISAGGSYAQAIVSKKKKGFAAGILELGLVWYL